MRTGLVQLLKATPVYPLAARLKRWGASTSPLHLRRQRAEAEAARRFYGQFVAEGSLCFDVGAHQGVRTDVFLTLGARVVAVEPQDQLVRQLREKYRANQRVTIIPQGLAAREGEATLFVCNYSTCSSMSAEWIDSVKGWNRLRGRKWETNTTVPVTTLDRLINEYGEPAFCKIDVEGFEWQVLQGLSRPLRALSLEYNPRHLAGVEKCVGRLHDLGQYLFNYSEGDSMQLALSEWLGYTEICAEIRDRLCHKGVYGDIYARLREV